MPDAVFGPTGALVGAVILLGLAGAAIRALWREHLEADKDDRAQRDRAMALATDAVDGTKRMAAAWERRNERDLARRRHGEP